VTQANADRLLAAWSPFWDTTKRLRLEKSPSNMIMTTFLQALFPGSAMIVLIRHPIAVALAMQKWNPVVVSRSGRRRTTLAGLLRHWLRAHELLRNDAPSVQRLYVVRYEDLVADPPARLAEIAEFLRLSAPLDPTGLRSGMSSRYQEQWDAARTGNPLRRRIRAAIETRYAVAVADYGYDIGQLTTTSAPLDRNRLFGLRPNG
jgi:hypothetical protein